MKRLFKRILRLFRCARVFRNFTQLILLTRNKGQGRFVLSTWDGLEILVRNNRWDARIVEEVYIERPYIQGLRLPPNPVVVDVGAYIGDFTLYAAKYLQAEVLAYEPNRENFAMLELNVRRNRLSEKVVIVNKAVGLGGSLVLNTWVEGEEVHVSAYRYFDSEKRTVACESLEEILRNTPTGKIDLLKLDCEGGEYDALQYCPAAVFNSIQNIVFEWHPITGYVERLQQVWKRLSEAGYRVTKKNNIVRALKT